MPEVQQLPSRRPFQRRRKTCPFSGTGAPKIDYKDSRLLEPHYGCLGQKAARTGKCDQALALPRPAAICDSVTVRVRPIGLTLTERVGASRL
jgi:hypothetical protein